MPSGETQGPIDKAPIQYTCSHPSAHDVALAAAEEANQLRDEIARLQMSHLQLNDVCWQMADYLGLLTEGVTSITMAPMELLRRTIAKASGS